MNLLSRCLGVLMLALAAWAGPSPAEAALNLCNRTSYVLYAATGTQMNTNVASQGWARVAPGGCKTVIPRDLTAPAYYVFARSSQAHAGPSRAWGGGANVCVKDTNFATLNPFASSSCVTDDFFQLPFAAVDIHHMRSWTMTLSETPALASLPQAQLAGLKRLLRDLGYRIGAIDGKPDRATDAAIGDFRKRLRLTAAATMDDLFDALETEALKTATPAGYSVCNDTAKSVAAALAQKQHNDWISHGWWKIAAGSCAKLAADLTGIESLYLFVQKIGGGPLVTGAEKFCVADIEFDIQGRTKCTQRGLTEAGFAETKVKGLSGYSAHVGEGGLVKPMRHPVTPK
ncbi:MAG: DUF1036 domain-containing protein [Rhizomicrobium sp.]